jgi:predicted dehydrogenase
MLWGAKGGFPIMKIGIIGYGYWGPNLVRNFMETADVEVVWSADAKADRRALAKRRYPSLKVTDSADEVIEDPELSAVVIATPISTHYELGRKALEAGKHVLLEKPLARTVYEAEQLAKLAEEQQRVLMVDHTFIYTGAVSRMKQIIDVGELGDLYYFDSVRVNLGLFQSDADVLWDLAPHDLSIFNYLIPAQPRSISALGADHMGSGLADMAYLTVTFENDFIAHFHVNWLSPVKVRRIMIGGDRRMMVYDDMEPSEKVRVYDQGVAVTTQEGMYRTLIDYRTGDMWAPKLDLREALAVECAHFVECVRLNRLPRTDAASGIAIVRLLEAATESMAAKGQAIML